MVWGAGGIGGPLGGRAGGRKENSWEDLFSSMEIRWMIGARRWSKMEAILASKGSEGVGGGGRVGLCDGSLVGGAFGTWGSSDVSEVAEGGGRTVGCVHL